MSTNRDAEADDPDERVTARSELVGQSRTRPAAGPQQQDPHHHHLLRDAAAPMTRLYGEQCTHLDTRTRYRMMGSSGLVASE